jgi:transmembrane sensor
MSTDAKARELLLDGDAKAAAAWRAEDPAHDQAWREAELAWAAIGRTRYAREGGWRLEGRRTWLPAAGAIAASLAAVAVIIPQLGPQPQQVRTATAETQDLTLADGSRVFVGAKSAVDVKLDGDSRTVVLKDGEAFFEVAKGDKRPFTVVAGGAVIRVTGTKFNVCRTPYGVQVAVLEGSVAVVKKRFITTPDTPDRVIAAGEQVRLERGEGLSRAEPVNAEPGAWRRGRLLYADAPLKEVVADANRYSDTPIRLASAELGELRVTVSFRTRAVDELIANLDAGLPIQTAREDDGDILLEPQTR